MVEAAGVILAKLEDVTGKVSYTAIYKGEVIVPAGTPQEFRATLKKALGKKGDKLKKELDKILAKGNHSINIPFFENAKILIQEEKALGKVLGQSERYTCVATSLKMYLDDIGSNFSENYIAGALKTDIEGAAVLDIPDGLYNLRLEHLVAKKVGFIELEDFVVQFQENSGKAIISVGNEELGAHAVLIDKIENDRIFIRDPLPQYVGKSYSVALEDFKKLFNKKVVFLK